MSERLQGHRTKLNANEMTCDGRCSSRQKQPVFSSFSRIVQSSGVACRSDVDAVTKSGRLFHTRATAAGKARSLCAVWLCADADLCAVVSRVDSINSRLDVMSAVGGRHVPSNTPSRSYDDTQLPPMLLLLLRLRLIAGSYLKPSRSAVARA